MRGNNALPPTYLLIAILSMVVFHFLLPAVNLIPLPWNIIGILPLALGIAINVIADSAFRKVGTTVKPSTESSALITKGVFRVSRNPMYLGFVFGLVGVAILLGSLTPWLVIPVFAVWMDRVFIQVEERMLEQKFGQTWLEYKRKVRRWI
jgi:protein-S-isoprenylcysteine O-methyltransferase Ste14